MKKIILFILLFSLIGCTMQNTNVAKTVRSGTQALQMSFLQNPTDIYEGSKFSTLIQLNNAGAEDITRGAYILRTDEDLVAMTSQTTGTFQLKGSQYGFGGQTRIGFEGTSKFLSSKALKSTTTLGFDACYEYTTIAGANVCVDTDIAQNNPKKVCTTGTTSLAGGQAAPVAVTSVTTKMMPGNTEGTAIPQFVITVSNVGGGVLTSPGAALSTCTGGQITKDDLDVVSVQAQLGGDMLDCGNGVVKVPEKTIVCTLDNGIPKSAGTYLSQLAITLDYGYQQTISQAFSIDKK